MRVHVDQDMTVNHNSHVVTLKAGQVVDGPLAVYLVESNCAVTIEEDDRPSPKSSRSSKAAKAAADPGA